MVKPLLYLSFVCLVFNKALSIPADSLKKHKIGLLPSAFYTPETRLGFGGLLYSYFKLGNNDSLNKKSNSQTYLSYTINKQFAVENDYQIWLAKNNLYLTGSVDYSRFPQFYYGIGNSTKESERIMYSYDLFRFQSKCLHRIVNHFYGGLFFNYQKVYNQDIELMSNQQCGDIYGGKGFTSKGIGPVFIVDCRDNPLNPAKGFYIETSYLNFKNLLMNKHMFSSFTLDLRKYHTLWQRLVSNSNLYLSFNKGMVPYRLMPEIGGPRFLRGYYRGRFRDNNMFILQQEFRMPIYKMFGLAIFGGIGNVASQTKELLTNGIHYNYGMGIRIRVNKKENTNLRIDYGITKDSHGLYIVFAEAF